jgi:hypothetical protein
VSTNDNLLLAIATLSMAAARRRMSSYAHPKSPQKFTQPQLLTCLVLKTHTRSTYRGIIELLELSPPLRRALGLGVELPHFTTLQKFAAGEGVLAILDAVLEEVVRSLNGGERLRTEDVAVDATGMQAGIASAHFQTRSGRGYRRWIRVSLVGICSLVMPAAMEIDWGPGNDAKPAIAVLKKAARAVQPRRQWGDRAYDSEAVHAFCHEEWGVQSYAPLIRRNGDGRVVRGRYRRRMRRRPRGYGRRWTVESLISAVKRTTGSALTSRREHTLKVEAALRVLTYAIRR